MCLFERQVAPACPLNMTLTARLSPQNACVEVGVPLNNWSSGVACCPNCRHELRVSLTPCSGKTHAQPQTPVTPPFTIHPPYLPQSPLYTTPSSPFIPSPYNDELRRLADTLRALRLSGWYYGNLDWQGARSLLKDASVGAFVIRDSGDRNFIFSLSVQTERGPTSVRLHFEDGFFRLDCDRPLARYMPRFRCVVELVQHYARVGERGAAGTVWVDREGCTHSPVLLKTPLRKNPPSLLHAARLAVHKALSNPLRPKIWCAPKHRLLPLPSTLIDYLGEYPYSI
ncbi:PREDICTED: suppressor of cytokine signaling 2-like isoform X1 [Papilio xuthus]|uniref:Suppressor of cytokine signaling 2-like isoform X1 n=2 Tax=Papilio xuthus TaxID=66420 RepID=A0AAJ6ZC04_PAPXU|nr:PREDICTED: suppressor of cytokine signaling 2-like isoform X1 [Papilio xuthus]